MYDDYDGRSAALSGFGYRDFEDGYNDFYDSASSIVIGSQAVSRYTAEDAITFISASMSAREAQRAFSEGKVVEGLIWSGLSFFDVTIGLIPGVPGVAGLAVQSIGKSSRHIALGAADHGLKGFAKKIGAEHLMNDKHWMDTLRTELANPATRFSLSLDGVSGSSVSNAIMNAVQRGASNANGWHTDWELFQVYQAGRLGDLNLYKGGKLVPNPFAR